MVKVELSLEDLDYILHILMNEYFELSQKKLPTNYTCLVHARLRGGLTKYFENRLEEFKDVD